MKGSRRKWQLVQRGTNTLPDILFINAIFRYLQIGTVCYNSNQIILLFYRSSGGTTLRFDIMFKNMSIDPIEAINWIGATQWLQRVAL